MMKKQLLTKMLLATAGLCVGASAWAEDTYETVYTRAAVADWTSDDVTDWNGASGVAVDETNGIGANANATATYISKTFSIGENNKVKYVVDWTYATATGRTNNWNWIQFGSFLRIAVNSSFNTQVSTDGGTTWNATALSYNYNTTVTKRIEVIFDTQLKKVEKFTFDGTDRTDLVSGNFSSATFNTVSTGFERGGSVSWTLNNYLTTITVSQAEQAAAAAATYTINYKYTDDGGTTTTVKTTTGTAVEGASVDIENSFTVDEVLYYKKDGEASSALLSAGENTIDIAVRHAYTFNYTLNATDGTNILKEIGSGSFTEGSTVKVYAPKAFYLDGVLYETAQTSFAKTFTTEETAEVVYAKSNLAYFFEETDFTKSSSDAFAATLEKDFFSLGYGGRLKANRYAYTKTLEGGVYDMQISGAINTQTPTMTYGYRLGDENTALGESGQFSNASYAAVQTVKDIAIPNGASFCWMNNTEYNSNLYVDYIALTRTAATATIGATGYTTFASSSALDLSNLPEGISAYKASSVGETSVTFTSVEEAVPAGTGLLLKGTANTSYNIPVAASAAALAGNKLVGVTTETALEANENYYVLVNNGGTAEFQSLAANGATIPAGKAYLDAAVAGARLRIVFNDETTGISMVEDAAVLNGKIYNLNGQHVTAPTMGLYIVNGKKVIMK